MRYYIFWVIVLVSMVCLVPSIGMSGETISENKVAFLEISEMIYDAALFKLSLAAIGAGNMGAPIPKKVSETIEKIASKYQIDTKKLEFSSADGVRNSIKIGTGVELEASDWSQFLSLNNLGKLPDVKFKGTIKLRFYSMSVDFNDKTGCRLNDKEYIYLKGKWFEK